MCAGTSYCKTYKSRGPEGEFVRALVHPRATQPFSTWMADSIIARNQGHNVDSSGSPTVNYEHGEFQQALRAVYAATNNTKYSDYIKTGIDTVVSSSGAINSNYNQSKYSLDDLRIGPSFIKLYQSTGSSKYLTAAKTYRAHINGQPRNTKGGFSHRGSSYPYQMWLDGIYMAEPFYTLYARDIENKNATAFSDIETQFKLLYANAFDGGTKLLKHGYFDRAAPSSVSVPVWADTTTGASPHVWDRAVGWYVMTLADLLTGTDALPTGTSAYNTLLAQFQQLIPALVTNADPTTGAWWLVMTAVGRSGNYIESSGSAMMVYAMLKAVSSGLVSDPNNTIRTAAVKAYNWLATNAVITNSDGTLNWDKTVVVGSLGSNGTFEYYIAQAINMNDLKGSAAFVLASVEYEKL
ncbi:glycosyl hydrolase [Auriculariales sp. MPI-PUGE-AT-0066]|nr:glycosyl hydrolase [Auriculariales sp. MPI-PUGE-AT-0066]